MFDDGTLKSLGFGRNVLSTSCFVLKICRSFNISKLERVDNLPFVSLQQCHARSELRTLSLSEAFLSINVPNPIRSGEFAIS